MLLADEVWGTTLRAMRSLAQNGVPVFVATVGRGSAIYRRSRYCAGATDIATDDPAVLAVSLRDWVERITQPGSTVVVIPLTDRLVEMLDAARDLFPERFRLSIPPPDVVSTLVDKERSILVAQSAGLDVPAWTVVRTDTDIPSVTTLSFPVVVRPTSWSTVGSQYFKIVVCHDELSLRSTLTVALSRGAEMIVQEYICAPEDAVEFGILWTSANHSQTVVCTGRKRRQAAPDGGVMVWGETIDLPDVRRSATAFVQESGFTGLGGIELIRHGGRLSFIEFNPRLEAIHFLAARAGVDTVPMEFEGLSTGAIHPHAGRQHVAAAWVGSAALARLRSNRGDWRLLLADRLAFGRYPRRVRAVLDWRDPLPAAAVVLRLFTRGVRSFTNRGAG